MELIFEHDVFPATVFLTDVKYMPDGDGTSGGFADIFPGMFREYRVALKRLRFSSSHDSEESKKLLRRVGILSVYI